jgi:hypothetical protein
MDNCCTKAKAWINMLYGAAMWLVLQLKPDCDMLGRTMNTERRQDDNSSGCDESSEVQKKKKKLKHLQYVSYSFCLSFKNLCVCVCTLYFSNKTVILLPMKMKTAVSVKTDQQCMNLTTYFSYLYAHFNKFWVFSAHSAVVF